MPYGGTTPEEDAKIERCVSEVMPTLKQYEDSEEKKSHAIAICKSRVMGKNFWFTEPNSIELKTEEEEFYVGGVVSTVNKDLGNDVLTLECLEDMATQINTKNLKLSFEHKEFLEGRPTINPIGRLFEAKVKDNKLWIKGILNKSNKVFPEVKQSIEQRFLDAFSIEYLINKGHPEYKEMEIEGKRHRNIPSINLLGVTLTGRPMNQDSFLDFYIKHMEEEIKAEKWIQKADVGGHPAKMALFAANMPNSQYHYPKDKSEKKSMEENMEAEIKNQEETPKIESKSLSDEELKALAEIREKREKERKIAEFKAMLNDLKEDSPFINPERKFGEEQVLPEIKNYMDIVFDRNENGICKHPIDVQFKAAAALHNALIPFGIENRSAIAPETRLLMKQKQNIKIEGKTQSCSNYALNVEYKAWSDGSGELRSTTSKVSAATHYQNAAELNDVYSPVIANQMNDITTTYGILKKVNASEYGDKYGFRARYGRNSTAQSYSEGDITVSSVADRQDRVKLQQPFLQYGILVQVSGLMQAQASGRGGIGDLFADEVKWAGMDLLKKLNQDLLSDTAAEGVTMGGSILNLQGLCDDTAQTTLYGVTRGSGIGTGLASALDTTQTGSPNVTKDMLRQHLRACYKNGAKVSDMIIIANYDQRDKILGQADPAQRFVSTSARIGFEGLPTFDDVPIHADPDCQTDHIYFIDAKNTYLVYLVAPTYEDLAKTGDFKRGMIKTYLNLVCETPTHVAMIDGLGT